MMKRMWMVPLVAGLALAGAASAWAQCCQAAQRPAKSARTQVKKDSSCCQEKAAAVAGARKAADCDRSRCGGRSADCCAPPKLVYRVGDQTTSCAKTAAKLAAERNGKTIYVLGEKEYEDEGAALSAYADALEAHLEKVTTVRYRVGDRCVSCPNEATALAKAGGGAVRYCVAGAAFDSQREANAAAQRARAAAEKVQMTMLVDGQSFTCQKTAQQACEKSGKKCTYVVGDTCRTECRSTARVELAKARIAAAREALRQTDEVASKTQP